MVESLFMFTLKDFFLLPQVVKYFTQVIDDDQPGMTLIAGLDIPPSSLLLKTGFFFSSGKRTLFETLLNEILVKNKDKKVLILAPERNFYQLRKYTKSHIQYSTNRTSFTFDQNISNDPFFNPELLILDQFDEESFQTAVSAANSGVRVLSQINSILWGSAIIKELSILGMKQKDIALIRSVISVRRIASLCSNCKQPTLLDDYDFTRIKNKIPFLADRINSPDTQFFKPVGCSNCKNTGKSGQITVIDISVSDHNLDKIDHFLSPRLSMEEYVFDLICLGYLSFDDLLSFEENQFFHLYKIFSISEQTRRDADRSLQRKITELEAANQVLLHRTEALVSLQDTVQFLTTSIHLDELADKVCRKTKELFGAERIILYYFRTKGEQIVAEVLAVNGWKSIIAHNQFPINQILDSHIHSEPLSLTPRLLNGLPPGIKEEKDSFQTGLLVPLVTQTQKVGLMVINSSQKKEFHPGEIALLTTFANQAALAIQRAGLIDELRAKLAELEAANVELVKKERLDHELEIARQVQQSVLPRVFPDIPGFSFTAGNLPARAVGGDFYDVFLLDENHIGLFIGDVSDKGMPAALYMALSRSLLLAEARQKFSPKEVVINVNRLLLEISSSNQFVSVFFGIIDYHQKQLVYTRAGHDRPILIRSNNLQILDGTGAVLGLLDDSELQFSEERVSFQSYDKLILFTDGLIDNCSPEGELYGLERLKKFFLDNGTVHSDELYTLTIKEMKKHQGNMDQFDDITLLIVEVL